MSTTKRIYESLLGEHLGNLRQMAFVCGPRQVGKTTTCKRLAETSLNWDNLDDREILLAGPAAIAANLGIDKLLTRAPVALFDELHKHARWKELLKGLYDTYADEVHILVTGSSRLDTYRRVGDSLMGRYFLYRMHPFSVAETMHTSLPDTERILRAPQRPKPANFNALWQHGGFPEPYLRRDARFTRRWQTLRTQQLVREDVRDMTGIIQLDQLEMLVRLLDQRSSHQLVYSNLANDIRTSIDTVRRWVETLSSLHHGFLVRPWHKNVSRSLRKEPKWFLRDWASIRDPGDRAETFIACHLLKAVEGWTDLGLGEFQLGYLRDKSKREVDFIVARDGEPWFLVEVKSRDQTLNPALTYFQAATEAPFAFQVVLDANYIGRDCFERPRGPLVVPAKTLLSQLL